MDVDRANYYSLYVMVDLSLADVINKMKQKFEFRCGHFERTNFIYATKFAEHPWHYFEEVDSISAVHDSLPAVLDSVISTLDKVRTIEVPLDEEQSRKYYENGKFIFKEKELKTYLQLANLNQSEGEPSKVKSKKTSQLIFKPGVTNPLYFLNEYEKFPDVKTDKDKMFNIRNFVDDAHRIEFSELFFTSNWATVREAFLKKYSKSFTANKKKELNIDFDEEISLRLFFERKLESLATYTSLPFINQVEMILYDLPNEISNLFLEKEKMTSKKTELLEFCDSIQDLVQTMRMVREEENEIIQDPLNIIGQFNFNSDLESDSTLDSTLNSNQSSSSSMNFFESESMAMDDSPQPVRGKPKRGRGKGLMAVRGGTVKRGRPSKNLKPIQESSEDSVLDYINQMSDTSTHSTRSSRSTRSRPY